MHRLVDIEMCCDVGNVGMCHERVVFSIAIQGYDTLQCVGVYICIWQFDGRPRRKAQMMSDLFLLRWDLANGVVERHCGGDPVVW
jgi:hypothetical protein